MNYINIDDLRRNYDDLEKKYAPFGIAVKEQITKILKDNNLRPHLISIRIKDIDSIVKKVIKNNKYHTIEEVTDICGIRIITYLASEVQKVCTIVRANYEIDEPNSVDKAKEKKHNEFGYISQHLIVSMPYDWTKAPTHNGFAGLKAEIQIRSILQHTWAEIEHDLGYKSDTAPNYEFARGFNRLAAILESADLEFDRLQGFKHTYKDVVYNNIKKNNKEVITINPISLALLIEENPTFIEVRDILTNIYKIKFIKRDNYNHIIIKLAFFEIKSINELNETIQTNKDRFIRFVRLFFERRPDKINTLIFEAPLEYFLHYLGSSKDEAYWEKYRNFGKTSTKSITKVVDFNILYKDSESKINKNQSIQSYFETAKSSLLEFLELYYIIEGFYSHCNQQMEVHNNYLQEICLNKVTPNMEILYELWIKAYKTIHQFLHIKELANKKTPLKSYYQLPDIYISIIYDALVTLWANVPYIETVYKIGDPLIGQTSADIIIGNLREKLSAIYNSQSESSASIDLAHKNLVLSLLAKFELKLKKYSNAKIILEDIIDANGNKVSDLDLEPIAKDDIIFGIERPNETTLNSELSQISSKEPTLSYIRYAEIILMCAESNYYLSNLEKANVYLNKIRSINGKSQLLESNLDTNFIEHLLKEWKETLAMQGSYFAAIKRNNFATKLLGISNYKIVLPIPLKELIHNPKMKQNDGY